MNQLIPSDESERVYIETVAEIVRSEGNFNLEFGNIQLRDLIRYVDNPNLSGYDFQVAFRRFTFLDSPRSILPRQRYFAGTYLQEKVIALNTNLTFRERPFTLAHEIGHLTLAHRPFAFKSSISNKMELQANYFAYCMLLPSEIFRQSALGYDFHLGSISKTFCCPMERIMKRLVMLFGGTQYISLRAYRSTFRIGKYCKNPPEQGSIKVGKYDINNGLIDKFLKQFGIPIRPRAYYRCMIPVGKRPYMFKFHTRYDIFHNLEILGFGYDMENHYEKIAEDPDGKGSRTI